MVSVALSRLEATGKKFCLLVEGSHIDFALHANDAAAAAHEALAYDEAAAEVLRYAAARADVAVIAVEDHSTGGSTLGMQRDWNITWEQPVCRGAAEEGEEGDVTITEATSCKAKLGTYAYGSTDGWSPLVLAKAKSSVQSLAKKICCEPQFRHNRCAPASSRTSSPNNTTTSHGPTSPIFGSHASTELPFERPPSAHLRFWGSGVEVGRLMGSSF